MTESKTQKEILEEKLREVNSRLTTVKSLIGISEDDIKRRIEHAELRHGKATGKARFVRIGPSMIEADDRLETLLELESHYDQLLNLEGKEPLDEGIKLLRKKLKVIKKLLHLKPAHN